MSGFIDHKKHIMLYSNMDTSAEITNVTKNESGPSKATIAGVHYLRCIIQK